MVHLFDMLRISMIYLSNDAANLNMKGIRVFLLTLYIVIILKRIVYKTMLSCFNNFMIYVSYYTFFLWRNNSRLCSQLVYSN